MIPQPLLAFALGFLLGTVGFAIFQAAASGRVTLGTLITLLLSSTAVAIANQI